jgi:hypothetical protein
LTLRFGKFAAQRSRFANSVVHRGEGRAKQHPTVASHIRETKSCSSGVLGEVGGDVANLRGAHGVLMGVVKGGRSRLLILGRCARPRVGWF